MDLLGRLKELGFARVLVLDGQACGVDAPTLLMALWTYEMEANPAKDEAWIHPYYRISHHAYQAARSFVEECKAAGIEAALRDDIRLKPIFARLPGFSQGRNTLSYIEGVGSRFYTKTFAVNVDMEPTHQMEEEKHELHCGHCRNCMFACPNHAIDEDGFHVERCIRYWMMPGKPVPEEVRAAMGNRLIGCDECQRCCPHNAAPKAEAGETVPLLRLLTEHKAVAEELKREIGVNLSLPNRLLAQGCMIAGNSGREELMPVLEGLQEHPSEAVRVHAQWAAENIRKMRD